MESAWPDQEQHADQLHEQLQQLSLLTTQGLPQFGLPETEPGFVHVPANAAYLNSAPVPKVMLPTL